MNSVGSCLIRLSACVMIYLLSAPELAGLLVSLVIRFSAITGTNCLTALYVNSLRVIPSTMATVLNPQEGTFMMTPLRIPMRKVVDPFLTW